MPSAAVRRCGTTPNLRLMHVEIVGVDVFNASAGGENVDQEESKVRPGPGRGRCRSAVAIGAGMLLHKKDQFRGECVMQRFLTKSAARTAVKAQRAIRTVEF